jgi:MerR family transcriptional regulator, heat shock protein HspR
MESQSLDANLGVYGITTAADLAGTGVQNLRAYEARGLLTPDRTNGGTRRYSANDIDRLRRIATLLGGGLNLAGIAMVLDLETENASLRKQIPASGDRSRRKMPTPSPPPPRSHD